MGSPVILKPTLSRIDKNETTTIDNKDVTFSVSSSSESVSIVDNGDGTFTLSRKAEGVFWILSKQNMEITNLMNHILWRIVIII